MIIGIGIDMVDSHRIEKLMHKFSVRFSEKYFTEAENKAALLKKSDKARILFYAKRFAAKEACAKALGTGVRDDVLMKNIEILNDSAGKPSIKLHNETKYFLSGLVSDNRDTKIHLTISDEDPYAIAQVLIEAV